MTSVITGHKWRESVCGLFLLCKYIVYLDKWFQPLNTALVGVIMWFHSVNTFHTMQTDGVNVQVYTFEVHSLQEFLFTNFPSPLKCLFWLIQHQRSILLWNLLLHDLLSHRVNSGWPICFQTAHALQSSMPLTFV